MELTWILLQKGWTIRLMVDSVEHVQLLDSFWAEKAQDDEDAAPLPVCVDVDMSFRLFGGKIHLGAHRSSIRSLSDFQKVVRAIEESQYLEFAGIMGYEAQIAGVGDSNPFTQFQNPFVRLLQTVSMWDVKRFRRQITEWLESEGYPSPGIDWIFNGGGTGSLSRSVQDETLSEVAAGSGFLQGSLFDYYRQNVQSPAFLFALQATRHPPHGSVTCQSGGFIAR